MGDDLGDRMKDYERQETARKFLPLLPVYTRIDGRNFTKFTRDFARPFDAEMVNAMLWTTRHLVKETHALIGYTQSDEISLVWMADQMFFDRKITKATSVLAGLATAAFNRYWAAIERDDLAARLPHFDARVIQLPSKTEAANMLLWREMDATKNAISMAARAYYSHAELQRKSGSEMQEMLFQKGINFNDYPDTFKRGSFVRRSVATRPFTEAELARIPEHKRPASDTLISRFIFCRIEMPKFVSVTNREQIIFEGAVPTTESCSETIS